jgi:hypothetical protein
MNGARISARATMATTAVIAASRAAPRASLEERKRSAAPTTSATPKPPR